LAKLPPIWERRGKKKDSSSSSIAPVPMVRSAEMLAAMKDVVADNPQQRKQETQQQQQQTQQVHQQVQQQVQPQQQLKPLTQSGGGRFGALAAQMEEEVKQQMKK
jgi:hypothetical protein